ncbi:MAG: SCP2 sterol-binding domain-containing protein [Actinobacteria bacterium]|nr:SCP2 sterol-binding domain-containing protein [Actinomycetota bacterium]MBU1944608.1 SCP2 sterol-binding domain-containing protein [Actinomycetota bacterium]MBU2689161.1 SCP2 sterol-binding domain-containing protein [Actinomycetota bacterium]
MAQFGSQEWVELLKTTVNKDKELPRAGKGFDATIHFVATGAKGGDIHFWTHMKDGAVLEAVSGEDRKCDFTLTGDYALWKEVVAGKQDPLQAIMTKKLLFEGNMQTVMKYIKAVNLVMESVKKVSTSWQ